MDFRKTKVRVNGVEESIKVQNVLFANGWSWGEGIEGKTPQHTEKPYLYFDSDKAMGYGNGEGYFIGDSYSRELTAKEIIGGRGKPVKEKPIDRHIVMEDSCNNSQGVFNSYEDAVNKAKELSGKMTIYRLFEVAKVESQRKVTKVKPETKKKTRKR